MGYLLINGDSRRLPIDLAAVDAVVTDPPYGIGAAKAKAHSSIRDNPKWDHADWDNQPATFFDLKQFMDTGKPCVIWGGNYFGLPPSPCWLVWNKPERNFSLADAELAWTNRMGAARCFDHPRIDGNRVHPTQKPIALMRWCIRLLKLPPNSLILDPYMGVGTTIIAALAEGHRAIGIEIDPGYCAIARRRLEHPHAAVPRPGRVEFHPLFGDAP
jgi:site-specific DNA-methyltransferase (adenine-specific)